MINLFSDAHNLNPDLNHTHPFLPYRVRHPLRLADGLDWPERLGCGKGRGKVATTTCGIGFVTFVDLCKKILPFICSSRCLCGLLFKRASIHNGHSRFATHNSRAPAIRYSPLTNYV
jgi:hypothetical protein